ncbi:hypothetical protein BB559_002250 [Furculomyces boomerangus]|uniref:polynucleotide adenylyltransferase n=1 Tax=Furculomyces boomerangus TaxID=61424 RepID=A0A2T9YWU7_9FUNG|nr:hypothetical protein BB559_002250 [Furculomyces boomerangus]
MEQLSPEPHDSPQNNCIAHYKSKSLDSKFYSNTVKYPNFKKNINDHKPISKNILLSTNTKLSLTPQNNHSPNLDAFLEENHKKLNSYLLQIILDPSQGPLYKSKHQTYPTAHSCNKISTICTDSEGFSDQDQQYLNSAVQYLLQDIRPSKKSNILKKKFLEKLDNIIKANFPDCNVEILVFGSTMNGLGTHSSDIDICLVTKKRQLEDILVINKALKAHKLQTFCIPYARVPIVKIWDPYLKVASDINVNNTIALYNTKMIQTFLEIDPRVQPFLMTIKHWTKQREINDAAFGGTLSPYSWVNISLVFLQMRNPPILPVLHPCENPLVDVTINNNYRKVDLAFNDNVDELKGFGSKNTESIGKLLFLFFKHFATEFDYENLVISLRHGGYLPKSAKGWHIGRPSKIMCIEEPFSTWLNLAHGANHFTVNGIQSEFIRAYNILFSGGSIFDVCEKYNSKNHQNEHLPKYNMRFGPPQNYSRTRYSHEDFNSRKSNHEYTKNKPHYARSNDGDNTLSNHSQKHGYLSNKSSSSSSSNNFHARSLSVEPPCTQGSKLRLTKTPNDRLSPLPQSPIFQSSPLTSDHSNTQNNRERFYKSASATPLRSTERYTRSESRKPHTSRKNSSNIENGSNSYNKPKTSSKKTTANHNNLSLSLDTTTNNNSTETQPHLSYKQKSTNKTDFSRTQHRNGKLSISALATSLCTCPRTYIRGNSTNLPTLVHLSSCVLGSIVQNSSKNCSSKEHRFYCDYNTPTMFKNMDPMHPQLVSYSTRINPGVPEHGYIPLKSLLCVQNSLNNKSGYIYEPSAVKLYQRLTSGLKPGQNGIRTHRRNLSSPSSFNYTENKPRNPEKKVLGSNNKTLYSSEHTVVSDTDSTKSADSVCILGGEEGCKHGRSTNSSDASECANCTNYNTQENKGYKSAYTKELQNSVSQGTIRILETDGLQAGIYHQRIPKPKVYTEVSDSDMDLTSISTAEVGSGTDSDIDDEYITNEHTSNGNFVVQAFPYPQNGMITITQNRSQLYPNTNGITKAYNNVQARQKQKSDANLNLQTCPLGYNGYSSNEF